jgi:hypothetical protein
MRQVREGNVGGQVWIPRSGSDSVSDSHDKSGVESNVTEGVASGDEYIFIAAYERQEYIRVRDVRLGLNPIELLPEKT